jgi:class 3 adenylate cyclase
VGDGELYFGPFRIDAADESLWDGERRLPLPPKTFAVLRYLVSHAGRLVTKDELLDAVWPDTHVADGVLKARMRELRAALADDADAPRYIATVHRRGYRFIGEVSSQGSGHRAEVDSDTRHPTPDPRSDTRHPTLDTRGLSERKHVTVLFAEVTAATEKLDPEAWHDVNQRVARIVAEGVHRFEGKVVHLCGTGSLVLFGAPMAHEDHAQRACSAALHLRDELGRFAGELRAAEGIDCAARMGLASGEVVAGEIGDARHGEYTASGPAVAAAQDIGKVAPAGHIHVCRNTATLVSTLFAVRDLGPRAVASASEPVHVFDLEGIGKHRTRLEAARARTRFLAPGRACRRDRNVGCRAGSGAGGQRSGVGHGGGAWRR